VPDRKHRAIGRPHEHAVEALGKTRGLNARGLLRALPRWHSCHTMEQAERAAQQPHHQLTHAADLVAERQRAAAAEEEPPLPVALQRRGELMVDAELAPTGLAVAQAALGQAVEPWCSAPSRAPPPAAGPRP